jgi:nucleobase:cation symporter-1, NCS1 family
VNYRAIVALAAGVVVALIGLLVPPLRWLYDYAWFVGFLVASLTYWISMRSRTVHQSAELPEMTRERA